MQVTVCFLLREEKVCLAQKRRTYGIGLWNGYGGRVKDGEFVEACAIRETHEESSVHVSPDNLVKTAVVRIYRGGPISSDSCGSPTTWSGYRAHFLGKSSRRMPTFRSRVTRLTASCSAKQRSDEGRFTRSSRLSFDHSNLFRGTFRNELLTHARASARSVTGVPVLENGRAASLSVAPVVTTSSIR